MRSEISNKKVMEIRKKYENTPLKYYIKKNYSNNKREENNKKYA
jgi:hypothetical protein